MTSSSHSQSQMLPLVNSDVHNNKQNKVYFSVLPLFGFINMTITSVITIYRAYNNNDIPMVVFIIFVYLGSFLLDYWSRLFQKLPPQSPKKRNVQIGIWALMSTIMLGFAWQFSKVMSLIESLCIYGVVIVGNAFLFYVEFIRKCDKSCGACNNGIAAQKEYKPLTEAKVVDNV